MRLRLVLLGGLIMAITVLCPTAAGAKVEPLEEIVVTAQKRSQSAQDVPIALRVLSAEKIALHGLRSLEQLSVGISSIRVSKSPAGDVLQMRGVASSTSPNFEQAVGTFIDGVYYGRSRSSRTGFLDVQRIEILKGPQSIYFGNNTIAGAFNILSRNPGEELDGYLSVDYEPVANERTAEAAIGGPVGRNFGIRVAAARSESEGWTDNPIGGRGPRYRETLGRITLAWSPAASFDANLKLAGNRSDGTNLQGSQLYRCPPAPPFVAPGFVCTNARMAYPKLESELNWHSDANAALTYQSGHSQVLNMNYRVRGLTVTSTTGHLEYRFHEDFDQDGTPLLAFQNHQIENGRQTSEELRVNSPDSGRTSFGFGGYWHDNRRQGSANLAFIGPPLGIFAGPTAAFLPAGDFAVVRPAANYKETSVSIFAIGTVRVTDTLRGTLGVRYVDVQKSARRSNAVSASHDVPIVRISALPPQQQAAIASRLGVDLFDLPLQLHQHASLPSLSLQWSPNADWMLYCTASRGFLAGGFDEATRNLTPRFSYDPETVVSHEVGFKSQWLDQTLIANVSLFHSKYGNVQRVVVVSAATGLRLAVSADGELTGEGVEVEARWRASRRVDLGINATWQHVVFGKFLGACSQTQTFESVGPCLQDFDGTAPPLVAEYSADIDARYTTPLGASMRMTAQADALLSSSYDTDTALDPAGRQHAYTKYGFRVGVGPESGPWELALIARNITDRKIKTFCGSAAGSVGSFVCALERRASLTVQANYRF